MTTRPLIFTSLITLSFGCTRIPANDDAGTSSGNVSESSGTTAPPTLTPSDTSTSTSSTTSGLTGGQTQTSDPTTLDPSTSTSTGPALDPSTGESTSKPPPSDDSNGPTLDCGDGEIDDGEQCDDGPGNGDTAHCSNNCEFRWLYAFVTSKTYTGDLNGFEGDEMMNIDGLAVADEQCQELAIELGVAHPGTYKAWLSKEWFAIPNDITSNIEKASPSTRFEAGCPLPIRSTADQNPVIANKYAQIFNDGSLESRIVADESGSEPETTNVWTRTDEYGNSIPHKFDSDYLIADCGNWNFDQVELGILNKTRDKSKAVIGDISKGMPDEAWTNSSSFPCTSAARLYCFQQCPQ